MEQARARYDAAVHTAWQAVLRSGPTLTVLQRRSAARLIRELWTTRDSVSDPALLAGLPEAVVEVLDKLVLDSPDITKQWYDAVVPGRLEAYQYVELVAMVALVVALDTFCFGLGIPLTDIGAICSADEHLQPAKTPGMPSPRHWVPIAARAPDVPVDGVMDALSLSPEIGQAFWELSRTFYLNDVMDFAANGGKALTRPQIEVVAATTASLRRCVF